MDEKFLYRIEDDSNYVVGHVLELYMVVEVLKKHCKKQFLEYISHDYEYFKSPTKKNNVEYDECLSDYIYKKSGDTIDRCTLDDCKQIEGFYILDVKSKYDPKYSIDNDYIEESKYIIIQYKLN